MEVGARGLLAGTTMGRWGRVQGELGRREERSAQSGRWSIRQPPMRVKLVRPEPTRTESLYQHCCVRAGGKFCPRGQLWEMSGALEGCKGVDTVRGGKLPCLQPVEGPAHAVAAKRRSHRPPPRYTSRAPA